ncbi:MAG: carbohydrate kinase family protein [Promethearchaeota archaeon]
MKNNKDNSDNGNKKHDYFFFNQRIFKMPQDLKEYKRFLVSIGSINLDFYNLHNLFYKDNNTKSNEHLDIPKEQYFLGGSATNTAYILSILREAFLQDFIENNDYNFKVLLCGLLGNDENANIAADLILKKGLDPLLVRILTSKIRYITGSTTIEHDENGERIITRKENTVTSLIADYLKGKLGDDSPIDYLITQLQNLFDFANSDDLSGRVPEIFYHTKGGASIIEYIMDRVGQNYEFIKNTNKAEYNGEDKRFIKETFISTDISGFLKDADLTKVVDYFKEYNRMDKEEPTNSGPNTEIEGIQILFGNLQEFKVLTDHFIKQKLIAEWNTDDVFLISENLSKLIPKLELGIDLKLKPIINPRENRDIKNNGSTLSLDDFNLIIPKESLKNLLNDLKIIDLTEIKAGFEVESNGDKGAKNIKLITILLDLQKAILSIMAFFHANVSFIKMGKDGAICITPKGLYYGNALDVKVLDTTGAGDAFNAGVLTRMMYDKQVQNLDKKTIKGALKWGIITGSLNCMAIGGTSLKITSNK